MHTDFLIIGAGPFGLSLASYCEHHDLEYLMLGKPMSFWRENMPNGLILRSDCQWHLDPQDEYTIDRYLETKKLERSHVEPMSLEFYLGYTDWFKNEISPNLQESLVTRLYCTDDPEERFRADLDDGTSITAKNVVMAVGFKYFRNLPRELTDIIPEDKWDHTCDLIDFDHLRDKNILVIGGRQSAYEWAALIAENGASEIHVSHRHETPDFTESDWEWIKEHLDEMIRDSEAHINMPTEKKQAIDQRFWEEGRLKLEPWLKTRIDAGNINVWPQSEMKGCEAAGDNSVKVTFMSGETVEVDHIVLATGYLVNMHNIPFLKNGNIFNRLRGDKGCPVLDRHLQTNIPGLFATSMMATQNYGLFFAFTSSARASAKIIGNYIKQS